MPKNYKRSRKTRPDKFPLTLHPTGQFCKKIKGKLYYFGTNKQKALQRYLEQASLLHSGKADKPRSTDDISLKTLCNYYLEHQQTRAAVGEIKPRQVYDQTYLLRHFVKFIGPNREICDLSTMDLQNYRNKLIKSGKAANSINNHIAAVKAMYHWAMDNEIIDKAPNLKAVKKISAKKKERPVFTITQLRKLLNKADIQMEAMILLGLNCGFGCTDCGELKWRHLDLKNKRVIYPRGKTGVNRNLLLWQETVDALQNIPTKGELVFYTSQGNPWVRTTEKIENGQTRYTNNNEVSKQFSKLLKKAGIKTEKGVGFYTLRRTAATLAARSGDPFAVQRLLGHSDLKMATVYVQDVSEQTDRVINNSRNFIIQDGS